MTADLTISLDTAARLRTGLTLGERQSPLGLGWRVGSADRVQLAEVPFLTMVNLRLDPGGPALAPVEALLGGRLPTEPNTVTDAGRYALLWLGPDEWLVVGPPGPDGPDRDAAALVAALGGALAGHRGSAVDVSANRTTVEVSGRYARDVLEKGCPLDLHPRAFRPGRCGQTLLARAQVVLWQTGDEPSYRILVRGSFASYLAAWLTDAAGEYWETGGAVP